MSRETRARRLSLSERKAQYGLNRSSEDIKFIDKAPVKNSGRKSVRNGARPGHFDTRLDELMRPKHRRTKTIPIGSMTCEHFDKSVVGRRAEILRTCPARRLRLIPTPRCDFYSMVVSPDAGPNPDATLVALRGQDGARTGMLLEDLLSPNVLIADHLNGEPISVDHGAPLRLVAPDHYGYKSIKHLSQIEFRLRASGYRASGLRAMDHLRARVALEERGRVLPGWLLRYLYRPLIPSTVSRFAKASKSRREG